VKDHHGDQLREAFENHESLAPDAAAVYARVQELSKTYRRRRLGGQVAGGAVLGAGLIAGVISLPSVLPSDPAASNPAIIAAAPPSPAPSVPATSPSKDELERYWSAYFDAGYDYEDAEKLAVLWQTKAEPGRIKAEAGKRLLAGETLPFPATPNPADPVRPSDPQAEREREAYFAAGYGWDEAVQLARIWKLADPGDAKAMGGKKLLAGEKLPVKPSAQGVRDALEQKRVGAFFDAGYDVDDAVQLAKIWKKKDAYGAKVEGGKRLLAGQTLPIRP
jgi:hypothetical protein